MATFKALVLMIIAIISIATSAIGIQAYNANTKFKNEHSVNFKFLVLNLVTGIFLVLACMATIFVMKGR